MKKCVVLFVCIILLGACTTIGRRYTLSGGPLVPRNERVDQELDLEETSQSYCIYDNLTVALQGNPNCVRIAEKVFSDFGFLLATDPHADYIITVEREDIGQGQSYLYGFGYSSRQKNLARARLTVFRNGIKQIYESIEESSQRQYYSGYYFSSYVYQNDPGELAFRGALIVDVGKFISKEKIPYYTKK